jgi:hypothetical protein
MLKQQLHTDQNFDILKIILGMIRNLIVPAASDNVDEFKSEGLHEKLAAKFI